MARAAPRGSTMPYGVAVDSAGNVYVADYGNHTIRKVTPAGVVTTLAGLAGSPGSADGTGSAARFNVPTGVAVDSAGNVYVADSDNHTIRKITPGGVVSTLAGLAGSQAAPMGRAARHGSIFPPVWRWTARATSMWEITKTMPFVRGSRLHLSRVRRLQSVRSICSLYIKLKPLAPHRSMPPIGLRD